MEISCEFEYDDYTYKCIVSSIEFPPNPKILSIEGAHERKYTHMDVNIICFESCLLSHIPRDLLRFFPKLNVIQVYASGLKEITIEDLAPYPNLIYLGIVCNELTSLPNNLFESTPLIEYVDFSMNKISKIGPRIFDSLKRLHGINLMDNKTINTCFINGKELTVGNVNQVVKIIKANCRPLESLQDSAASKLSEIISEKNAMEIYFFSSRFNIIGLKLKTMRFIKYRMMKDIDKDLFNDPDFLMNFICDKRKESILKK